MPDNALVWIASGSAAFYAPSCIPAEADSIWAVVEREKALGRRWNEAPTEIEAQEAFAAVQGMRRIRVRAARRMGLHPARGCSFDQAPPSLASFLLRRAGILHPESRWNADGTWRW